MFSLHCTARLLKALDVSACTPSPTTTRLGNWYANLLLLRQRPAILCVSERAYLPVLLAADVGAALPRVLPDALAVLLRALEVPPALIEKERFAMAQSTWAKTESRSLVGVMNEFAFMASRELEHGTESFAEVTQRLASGIVKLQFPIDLTREAFGLPLLAHATLDARRQPGGTDTPAGPARESDPLDAIARAFVADVKQPADGFVIAEPVQVTAVTWDGNARRGLVATCRRGDDEHRVSFADVVFPAGTAAAKLSNDYLAWLGLPPNALSARASTRRHKAAESDLDLSRPIELVVLAVKATALRCRLPGTQREVTLRTPVRDEVPGEIVTIAAAKQWSHAGHPYLSGKVTKSRLDVEALGLTPLELRAEGDWDPEDEYWGEEGEPLPEWAKEIVSVGKRPAFEMGQVTPGADPDDPDSDPIVEASETRAAGHELEASDMLNAMLAQDLRCIDAHAHLGNAEFEHSPKQALRHYQAGASIGGLTLGGEFKGVLPWGLIDNRPYLRCLHGLGLCWWRLGHMREAAATFRRMLWLNPSDNQGVRFNLDSVEAGHTWDESEGRRSR